MSYNLFGWNAFRKNEWRSKNILKKIRDADPAVLGAQEVERGGGCCHDYVAGKLKMNGRYAYAGGNIFYRPTVVKKRASGNKWVDKSKGRSIGWAKFSVIKTGKEFLFFNTHWHNHGGDHYWFTNAQTCAKEISRVRSRYGDLPAVLVGDFNVWTHGGSGAKAIRYLFGKTVDRKTSPVKFENAIPNSGQTSYGHVVDYIMVSRGQWTVVSSRNDMDGCGEHASASDHGALTATLDFKR